MVLKSFAFCFPRIFLLIHHANGISWSFHLLCDDPPEDLPFQHCRGPHFSTADRMGVHHVAPWMENPKSQIRWNGNGPKKHTLTLFSCDHASPPYNQNFFTQEVVWEATSLLDLPYTMAMKCIGLAKEWERDEQLRDRLREEKKIMIYPATDKFCKPNRVNAVTNEMIILPVLKRLQVTHKKKLPHLDDLTVEVQTLCEKTGLSTADRFPYKTSVEVKKMAGFIKRRVQKKEVTKEKG